MRARGPAARSWREAAAGGPSPVADGPGRSVAKGALLRRQCRWCSSTLSPPPHLFVSLSFSLSFRALSWLQPEAQWPGPPAAARRRATSLNLNLPVPRNLNAALALRRPWRHCQVTGMTGHSARRSRAACCQAWILVPPMPVPVSRVRSPGPGPALTGRLAAAGPPAAAAPMARCRASPGEAQSHCRTSPTRSPRTVTVTRTPGPWQPRPPESRVGLGLPAADAVTVTDTGSPSTVAAVRTRRRSPGRLAY